MLTEEEVMDRAFRAWSRSGDCQDQPANTSGVVVGDDGRWFAELHNCKGTLAVYEVDDDHNRLRRLHEDDWPPCCVEL
jgi:hypothetical protein